MDMHCRQPQHVLVRAHSETGRRGVCERCSGVDQTVRLGEVRHEPHQRPTTGKKNREPEVGNSTPLLPVKNASCRLRALAEAQQANPVARSPLGVVGSHGECKTGVDRCSDIPGCQDFRHVVITEPDSERAVVSVDRRYIWPGFCTGEWSLCIDETKRTAKVLFEHAALHPEDHGVSASAVEAEDAW